MHTKYLATINANLWVLLPTLEYFSQQIGINFRLWLIFILKNKRKYKTDRGKKFV